MIANHMSSLVRTMELQDRLETIRDQMQKASTEMEESKGPHSAKYHELKKREAMITGEYVWQTARL